MYFIWINMFFLYSEITKLFFTGSLLIIALIISFVFFYFKFYKNQIRLINERNLLQIQFQKEILQTQLEIQEQTLKNISQEIHDNIGQALTLAKLNLNAVLPVAEGAVHEKITNSKELVSKAIGDLRDLSRSLDTDYVKDMGLQRAIEYELEMMRKTGTISTQLQVEGSGIALDKQKELILFRIIQETFNNIIKHAEATQLEVTMYYKPSALELLITDNGKGVDLTPLNEGNSNNFGLGIRNMHNRARLIGAGFSMSSSLGQGTEVKIVLPVENSVHENKQ